MSMFFGDSIRGNPTIAMKNVAPATDPATLKIGTPVKSVLSGDTYIVVPCPSDELNNMIGVVANDKNDKMLEGHIASGKINIMIGGDATVNVRLPLADQTPTNLAKIGVSVESINHSNFLENDCVTTGEGIRITLGAVTNPSTPSAVAK